MSSLAVIKQALQRPEALILVMNDFLAKKVSVAWELYQPEPAFVETAPRKGETSRKTLERYWQELNPDLNELAAIAGLPVTRVMKIFKQLRAAYIIWPDGTISHDVQATIIGERNAYVRSLMDRRPPAPDDKKGRTDERKPKDKSHKKSDRKPSRAKARV